jgi:hypothetical protein
VRLYRGGVGWGSRRANIDSPQGLNPITDKLIRTAVKWLYETQPPDLIGRIQVLEKFMAA